MRIGIDLGGHTLIAALVSEPGPGVLPEIARLQSEDTPPGRGVREVLDAMAEEIARLSGGVDISSVGVAVPGMLDKERRLALRLPNFPRDWDGLDIPEELGAMLVERKIHAGGIRMENDANCYALGEGLAGEAVGVSDFVTFTLGTGIGCGIVSGGRLITGAHGMAGEGGHMVVSGDEPCGCGGVGHSETIAAADGTTARALAKGLPGDFRELWAMRGRRDADEVIGATLDAMARTIASACHLMDPAMVIIGGGMSRADGIAGALRERTIPYLSTPFKDVIDVRVSRLGNEAALYGAAGLGR
jgi:glucokinase